MCVFEINFHIYFFFKIQEIEKLRVEKKRIFGEQNLSKNKGDNLYQPRDSDHDNVFLKTLKSHYFISIKYNQSECL